MNKKEKITLFICGALIGCSMVAFNLHRKYTKKESNPKDAVAPWHGPILYTKALPQGDQPFKKRVRIIQDPGLKAPIRFEETFETTISGRDRLISRRVMDPKTAIIRIQQGVSETELEPLLEEHNCWIDSTREPGVFLIRFEHRAPDPLPVILEKLQARPDIIEQALPNYLPSKV